MTPEVETIATVACVLVAGGKVGYAFICERTPIRYQGLKNLFILGGILAGLFYMQGRPATAIGFVAGLCIVSGVTQLYVRR